MSSSSAARRRDRAIVCLVAIGLTTPGCRRLVDLERFQIVPDAGSTDAQAPQDGRVAGDGGDASVDPDGPTAPVVRISPMIARTADDLVFEIVAESSDPLGAGPVTYEPRWLRDGVDSGLRGDTVSASSTARGEVWRVELTPISADGTRRGAAGIADATIANTPPVLITVGLAEYAPILGERITAAPGPIDDADGDDVSVRFQWFRGDEPIASATTNALSTAGLSSGDRLRAEAWAFDGESEGPRASVGPVTLSADTTQWRQILPQPLGVSVDVVIRDEAHDRYVRVVDGGVWEYVVQGSRVVVARLPASGTPPLGDRVDGFHDETGRRLIVMTESDRTLAHVLDLRQRGAETWSTITIAGSERPRARFASATWFDAESRRVWAYGGLGGEVVRDTISEALWSLDVTPGSERWTRHDMTGDEIPGLVGASMARDPARSGGVVLAGGGRSEPSSFVIDDRIYRLDLRGTPVRVERLGAVLPQPRFGGSAATTETRVILAGGTSQIGGEALPLPAISLDPDTAELTVGSVVDAPVGSHGILHADRDEERLVFWPGVDADPLARAFGLFDVGLADLGITSRAEMSSPPPLSHAVATVSNSGRMILIGGRSERSDSFARVLSDEIWEYDPATKRWQIRLDGPDPILDARPRARWGVVSQSNTERGAMVFGGVLDDESLADGQAWTHFVFPGQWIGHTLRVGEVAPQGREGAAVLSTPLCGSNVGAFVGGRGADGVPLAESALLECNDALGQRDCRWLAASGAIAARSYAALGADVSVLWLYGGLGVTVPLGDLYSMSCGGGWTGVTPTGTAPAARFGHSFSYVRASGAAVASFVLFGGATSESPAARLGDVRRLVLTSASTARWEDVPFTSATAPEARAFHVSGWIESSQTLLVYGGMRVGANGASGDLWELRIR